MSGLVEKVKEKVDQVLHKDQHHNTAGTHTGTHTGAHTGTHTGAHTGVGSTHTGATGGYGSTNTGPHSSNLANKADPRVDSDRDHSSNLGAASYGPGGAHNTAVGGTTTAGPHSSNLANKLDPRVDSDRDGSNNFGAAGHSAAHPGATGGLGSHGNTGYPSSTTAGPHSSNVANKLDPRVDSDRDGSNNFGAAGQSGYGNTHSTTGGLGSHGTTSGYGNTSTNAGPHDSNLLNKLDPRVDSDRDGAHPGQAAASQATHGQTGGYGTSHTGTTGGYGSSNQTAGPHSSNIANKLDPRVDSDLDGSRTAPGNPGYGQQGGLGGQGGTY